VVVIFPTEHFHYDFGGMHAAGAGTASLAGPPFTELRETLNDHLLALPLGDPCLVGENVLFTIYDRDENIILPNIMVDPPPLTLRKTSFTSTGSSIFQGKCDSCHCLWKPSILQRL